jgi:hypothetical protein
MKSQQTQEPRPGKNRGPSEILNCNDDSDAAPSFQALLARRVGDVASIGELMPLVLRLTVEQARRGDREAT